MPKRNVLIYQPAVPHYRSGFFFRLFNENDYNVEVRCGRSPKVLNDPALEQLEQVSTNYPIKPLFFGLFYWQVGADIPKNYAANDIVVLIGSPRLLSNLHILFAANRRRIRTVWWGHGGQANQKVRMWLRSLFMRAVDSVAIYTKVEAELFENLGIPRQKLFGLNNTVDTVTVQTLIEKQQRTAKRRKSFSQKKMYLVFVGRLTEKINLAPLIRALKILPANSVHLDVVGDGEQLSKYKALTEKSALSNTINFHGEIFDGEEMAQILANADASVYPGNIGLSLLHSFAAGLPVLTQEQQSLPEFAAFEESKTGLTFRTNDPSSIAQTICLMIEDPNLLAKMKNHVFQLSKGEFSINHMVSQFLAALAFATVIEK